VSDRYLKIVLTVIALELGWLGIKDLGTPVKAQAPRDNVQTSREPTPVVIRGVEGSLPIVIQGIRMNSRMPGALPIYGAAGGEPVAVSAPAPLPIEAPRPLPIMGSVPLKIQADRPIPVENVGYTPGLRPGE
jgi:hypothetical protein